MEQLLSERTSAARTLSRPLAFLLALSCGLVAANLYYAQPLIDPIEVTFGISAGAGGLIVTVARLWKWPLVLAALTLFGLLAALLGQDAVWWIASWVTLAAPLAVIVLCVLRS